MSRFARKVDDNQGRIVNELRALHMSVTSLAKVADGCPDIVVGYAGINLLFELKGEKNQRGEPADLTKLETKWHESWLGQVAVVTSSREVVAILENELKRRGIRYVPPALLAHLLL